MCWQRVRWEEEPPDLRVSQADRDEVIEQLRTHTADGRLDLDEFGERVEEALAAKHRSDLDRVLRQLPRLDRPRRLRGLSPAGRVLAVVVLVALAAMVVGGWVFFLLFWLIPMAGGGGHHHRRERELVHL